MCPNLDSTLCTPSLRPVLDPIIRIWQNGFCQGRSTVGQIIALRRILEGVKEKNLSIGSDHIH